MTRKRVDPSLVERALTMREQGRPVDEILSATGLSNGTYYAYLHAHIDTVELLYADQTIKPMLSWPGSKRDEIDDIKPYVPDFEGKYIEPFLGSGALFFELKPKRALLSDANSELISFYGAVRDGHRRLHGELTRLESEYAAADEDGKKAMYRHARDIVNGKVTGDMSEAAAFFIVNKTSYSGLIRRNRRGEYNVPWGREKMFHAADVTALHARALRDVELLCCDYSDALSRCEPGDFVFLDPPYDSKFSDYGTVFDETEHRLLAEVFHALPCPALMIVGRTPLTLELYGADTLGEYVRDYKVNMRKRVSSTGVHLIVGHLL